MKEAYYFSHDSNARHDPKIKAMRGVYGLLGYAWYWVLIEMMREQDGYKLEMRSKYAFHAFASEMQCEPEKSQEFITDCINEFKLFDSDETHFWSVSLLRRMQKKEEVSNKARKSAEARWAKKGASNQGSTDSDIATTMREECERIDIASESDALKESKGKESTKDKKISSRQRKTYAEDSSAYRMGIYLHDKIMGYAEKLGKAHLVRDADMQKWADECRKILELDKRDKAEVWQVINWVSADVFWQGIILSPTNLRKHYKELCLKMASSSNKSKQGSSSSNSLTDRNRREKEKIKELMDRAGSGSQTIVLDNSQHV